MKNEERNLLIVGLAALFRTAAIINGTPSRSPNNDAIKDAQDFLSACERANLLPPKE